LRPCLGKGRSLGGHRQNQKRGEGSAKYIPHAVQYSSGR
jgi:hypothetical protein